MTAPPSHRPVAAEHLLAEQLALVFAAAPAGIVVTSLTGLATGWVLWPVMGGVAVGVWGAALAAVLFYRAWLCWRWRQPPVDRQRLRFLLMAGFAATGAIWGALPLWLFPAEPSPQGVFVMLSMVGMSAGAITSVSILRPAAYYYVLPMLVPLSGRLIFEGSTVYAATGAAVILLGAIFFSNATRLARSTEDNIRARLHSEAEAVEHARIERALRDSRATLEDAQRMGRIGSWSWDLLSGKIEWSPEVYRILGLDPARVAPAQDAFIRAMVPDDIKLMEASFARGLAGEREFDDEWRMIEAGSGKIKNVQLRGERFFDGQGALTGMKGTLQDISERKQAEQAKSDFIATVSHELRTPLTSIYGALRLLTAGVGSQDAAQLRTMLDLALRNAEQLIALVNDILDMASIDRGRFAVTPAPANLTALLAQAVDLNRGYAQHFGVDIVIPPPGQPVWVHADTARVTQVIGNLVSNAIKFAPPGTRVDVAMAPAGSRVRVAVADHGPGVPEAFRSQLFDRFARADSSSTRSTGGTGLGLSIAKVIVEAHGGRIGYEPRPGGGSTFYFELPVAAS